MRAFGAMTATRSLVVLDGEKIANEMRRRQPNDHERTKCLPIDLHKTILRHRVVFFQSGCLTQAETNSFMPGGRESFLENVVKLQVSITKRLPTWGV